MLDDEDLGTFNSTFVPSVTAFRVFLQGEELLRSHRAEIDWKTTLRDQVHLALMYIWTKETSLGL
ncbi:MAG: hypothetical protein CM15mP123_05990 [Gammaproteobacteria bacterium]|nr:MAG: hypothetical protein CM15mP123_05990 [Gammaproteobacteria bacterium]